MLWACFLLVCPLCYAKNKKLIVTRKNIHRDVINDDADLRLADSMTSYPKSK